MKQYLVIVLLLAGCGKKAANDPPPSMKPEGPPVAACIQKYEGGGLRIQACEDFDRPVAKLQDSIAEVTKQRDEFMALSKLDADLLNRQSAEIVKLRTQLHEEMQINDQLVKDKSTIVNAMCGGATPVPTGPPILEKETWGPPTGPTTGGCYKDSPNHMLCY